MAQIAPPGPRQGEVTTGSLARLQGYAADPDSLNATQPTAAGGTVEGSVEPEKQGKDEENPELPQPQAATIPVRNIQEQAGKVPGVIARLPSPGGIAFVVIVLLLLWVLMIRVNGKSRWQWLWEVLTGNAIVTTDPAKSAKTDAAGLRGGVLATGTSDNPLVARPTSPPQDVTDVRVSTPITPSFVRSSSISVTSE